MSTGGPRAFRAYYENMPLRRSSRARRVPTCSSTGGCSGDELANLHMLDTRQFRDDQACGDGCRRTAAAAEDPARSLPARPRSGGCWTGSANCRATWDVLGQQVFFAAGTRTATPDNDGLDGRVGRLPPPHAAGSSTGWVRTRGPQPDRAHRRRARALGLGGAGRLRGPDSPVVGSEFVTSSVTSGGDGYDEPTGQHPWAAYNPNLRFWTNLRGYVNTRITPTSFTADYRCVPKVSVKGAAAFTRARFVVDDGVRGMRQTLGNPGPAGARIAPRSDARKIRDTLVTESH